MVALAVSLSGYGLYQYAYELPATRASYERDPVQARIFPAGVVYKVVAVYPFEPAGIKIVRQ